MPQKLEKYSLKELAALFSDEDEFYFNHLRDGVIHFHCQKGGLVYIVHFFTTIFSELTQPCTIHDIIAAIDEGKSFGVSMQFI